VDIGVDWGPELVRLGEASISTVDWAVDPEYPGLGIAATIAGIPYQPRLDGSVAKCRIKAGTTQDTVLMCTATFTSGQVLQDKTYVKIIK